MQTIIPPDPVFFFTKAEGKLFRILAFLIKDGGDVDALLDNGRTMKNFNKLPEADLCFSGHCCPEWMWRQAKKAAEQSGVPSADSVVWRCRMYGVTVAEPDEQPPHPSDETLSWALEDLLTRRCSDILGAMDVRSVKDLLIKGTKIMKAKAVKGSLSVSSEIRGFLGAYGVKVEP